MKVLYDQVSEEINTIITKKYSTSFSMGIRLFDSSVRPSIYNVYGYVRLADEIVDSFSGYPQEKMLNLIEKQTYEAIDDQISINPVLHSFQKVFNQHSFNKEWVDAFLKSMRVDLQQTHHDESSYRSYIYGSAEVVGLMCLKVFCEGNHKLFDDLQVYAESLGAAFQKINFLRDINADYQKLHRIYFPNVDFENFTEQDKRNIEKDIEADFAKAKIGIDLLPESSRYGVLLAYEYYMALFCKIKKISPEQVKKNRIRVSNTQKVLMAFKIWCKKQLLIK